MGLYTMMGCKRIQWQLPAIWRCKLHTQRWRVNSKGTALFFGAYPLFENETTQDKMFQKNEFEIDVTRQDVQV
jgi:hypothetical protein